MKLLNSRLVNCLLFVCVLLKMDSEAQVSIQLDPSRDTYINSSSKFARAGSSTTLRLGVPTSYQKYQILVDYDLESYLNTEYPLSKAELLIETDAWPAGYISTRLISEDWDEYRVNYYGRPANYPDLEVSDVVTPEGYRSLDVTELVLEYLNNPSSYFGFLVFKSNGYYGYIELGSRESSSLPPIKLQLEFDISGLITGGGSSPWHTNTEGIYYADGNVGVRTPADGTYALKIDGTVRTKEVSVSQDGWADYVFQPNYPLMPIDQLNKYIQENGHLPNIPTERDVKHNGILLGEINQKLLEKIEELTLYIIQQDKRIKKLESQ